MFPSAAPSGPSEDQDIESWVRSMFGDTLLGDAEGVKLVVKIDGRVVSEGQRGKGAPLDADTRAIIRELTQSLAMHGGVQMPGDTHVPPPPTDMIRRALGVLVDASGRRRTLGAALAIFGRRVTAQLERILASAEAGPTARLVAWRGRVLRSLDDVTFTHESIRILRADLERLLTDDYLAMVGDNEEKFLRPRLTELAHRVIEVLGDTFHRALERFGGHIDQLSESIVRQLPKTMTLRDLPSLLKRGFVDALSDFLAV